MARTERGIRTDGEATRTRILEAAGALFAAGGFAETTSKAIAARAGVDLASINYHFGSRNGLYQAVLAEALRRLVDLADLQRLTRSARAAPDKLRALIDQLVPRAADPQGWHLTVLAAEALAPSSHIQVLMQSEVAEKASLVTALLSEITGIPARNQALVRCLVSVVAPCMLLQIGRRGISGPLEAILRMPRKVVVDHLHTFALAGLNAIGAEYGERRGRE